MFNLKSLLFPFVVVAIVIAALSLAANGQEPQAIESDDVSTYVPIEKRTKHHDRKHDDQSDAVTPDAEPVESLAEREKRRRAKEEAEKNRHLEQERHQHEKNKEAERHAEEEAKHPQPAKPGLFGWLFSWTIGPVVGAVFPGIGTLLSFIKWAWWVILLTVVLIVAVVCIFCGSTCLACIHWIAAKFQRKGP